MLSYVKAKLYKSPSHCWSSYVIPYFHLKETTLSINWHFFSLTAENFHREQKLRKV